jgi:serine/threonine protein phosphatase 1
MIMGEACVPANTRLYAIGDIHGCISELKTLFDMIEADMNPAHQNVVITVGDYCDRGPDTHGVIEFLTSKIAEYAGSRIHQLVCLRGNHDQRFLEFIDIPQEVGDPFLTFGGRQTLMSYGIDPDAHPNHSSMARAFGREVPRHHLRFLDALPLMHVAGDYAFVHAGIRPGRALEDQSVDDLLWIRNAFLQHQGAHSHVIVHGHTIYERFDVQPNRINLDTGAFETGILSCAILEGTSMRKLQTPPRKWNH